MKTLKQTARIAGWLYLSFLVIGVYNFFYIPSRIVVEGNAALTARNIMENELLFRFGIVSNLIGQVIFIFLVLVLYQLFRDTNKSYARLMVALVVASVSATCIIILHQTGGLIVLRGADFMQVFDAGQLHALSFLFHRMYTDGIIILGIFWGLWLYPFGWLVIRSGFMPKILGVLLIISCFAFLIDSFSFLLIPKYHQTISSFIMLPMSMGEISMIGWLVLKGVKENHGSSSASQIKTTHSENKS